MSFEIEFRLPSTVQYAYVGVKVSADSIDELHLKVTEVQAYARQIGRAESALNASFMAGERDTVTDTPSHNGAVRLVEEDMGGEVISEETAERAIAAAAVTTVKPWERPVPVAKPKPWERKGAAPAALPAGESEEYVGPRVKFPFLDADNPDEAPYIEERKKKMQDFYVNFNNSLGWNKAEKCYRFHHNPDGKTMQAFRDFCEYWGGELI